MVGLEGITQITGTVKSTITKWLFHGGTVERTGVTGTETGGTALVPRSGRKV
jgi:hypothetical protein